ncbi:hypothetical protein EDB85DRAFT_1898509 [Lactarius pseudohatsudake]|nr:hypothetical protein EDB85DRAFT_1898509 [Lactarius pseudohatsudake]
MGSRTGHNDIDPATRMLVPEASERGSPHCDSATMVGGGRPKVVRGRWRRKRYGAALQGPLTRRRGLSVEKERVYRVSLHGQDSTKDRLATPVLPRLPLLRLTPGAKSGLTVDRRRVLMVAHYGQQDQPQ